jgi:pimeloyl-ACP methyl ester carboxylesterase
MLKKVFSAIFILIVLLLLYIAYGRKNLILSKEIVRARYTTPASHFLNWNGNVVHYTDDGSGMPVLMIHGFGGSSLDFRYLDSLMTDKYRIIRVDLPGFGLSDFPALKEKDPDYNRLYNNFFNFFIDTLHLDSMYVAGNSMGGMAGWALAVSHPDKVKKLVLLSSAGYDMDKVVKVAARIFRFNAARLFFEKGIPEFITKTAIRNCFANPEIITDQKAHVLNDLWNREGNLDVFFDLGTTHKWLDTTLIQRVSCPTLILWGKEDKIIPVNHAERFHRDIRNSRVIIYSPCGHVPMVECVADVNRDMQQFFSE